MKGLRIKEICREHGITLKELANEIGITSVGLSQSLRGYPNTKTLETIANALQVPISALFEAESTNTIVCPHCGKKVFLNPCKDESEKAKE